MFLRTEHDLQQLKIDYPHLTAELIAELDRLTGEILKFHEEMTEAEETHYRDLIRQRKKIILPEYD